MNQQILADFTVNTVFGSNATHTPVSAVGSGKIVMMLMAIQPSMLNSVKAIVLLVRFDLDALVLLLILAV